MESDIRDEPLDMLAFGQLIESKFKTLDEDDEEMSDLDRMRQELLQTNKLSHNFTPKTPGKPS